MADTAIWTNTAQNLGAGSDWEALAIPTPNVPVFFTNWSLPAGPNFPIGYNLLIISPSRTSLAATETFNARDVDLEGGASFSDFGTLLASSLTLGENTTTNLVGEALINGVVTLNSRATLDIRGVLNDPIGAFNGQAADQSSVMISGTLDVGTASGASFTLGSVGEMVTFHDFGRMDVGGSFVLQGHDSSFIFNSAVVSINEVPNSGSSVSIIDNAHGTVSINNSSFIVGQVAPGTPPKLELGQAHDQSTVHLVESSITGVGKIDNLGTLATRGSNTIGVRGSFLNDGADAVTSVESGRLSFQSAGRSTLVDPASLGSFEIGMAGTLDLGSNANVGEATVQFTSNSGRLAISGGIHSFTSAIRGGLPGDQLELIGATIVGATYDGSRTVRVDKADGSTTLFTDITFPGQPAGPLNFRNTGGNGFVTLCYFKGTRILTPTGEMPVEALNIGDRVVTRFNGIQPIKWIGRQSFDARFIQNNRAQCPVRISAGALADHMPARDLFISPGHSMLLDGQLILARFLVNGINITQDLCHTEIQYFQIELEMHDCVIAEGVWSETFADGPGLRQQFHNAAEFARLYPNHSAPPDLSLCAPRPEHGPRLERALRPVMARASATRTPGPLRGYIDRIEAPWKIKGWAQDINCNELPVLLEILVGDESIATILACDYRQDLQDAGIGQGRCAFFLTSPVRLSSRMLSELRVRRASDCAEIHMTHECRNQIGPLAPTERLSLTAASHRRALRK